MKTTRYRGADLLSQISEAAASGDDARWRRLVNELRTQLQEAAWDGDDERLRDLAPCSCCCADHTFSYCPARLWDGCRSGLEYGVDHLADERSWREHYDKWRGEGFFDAPWKDR